MGWSGMPNFGQFTRKIWKFHRPAEANKKLTESKTKMKSYEKKKTSKIPPKNVIIRKKGKLYKSNGRKLTPLVN